MYANTQINIDMASPGVLPRVYAIQGEKNSRFVSFTLYNNGQTWSVDAGTEAVVRFRRADGTGGSYATDENGDKISVLANIVAIPLLEAVCTLPGPVTLTVELISGGVLIATWPVTVMVQENPGYSLDPAPESDEETHTDCVKTVNGVAPNENGNVEVVVPEEKPVHMDLSGYEAGTIVLTYADGGKMNIDVTFDANGNSIKFSNGVEEFTITWPAEEATETAEEGTA